MGQAASQAAKFYEEVAEKKAVWAAKADGQYLKFDISNDRVSMPLWSSKSRIERIKKLDPARVGRNKAQPIAPDESKQTRLKH